MRSILAFVRVGWLNASSYRLSMILSLIGVSSSIVPVYFISKALQPLMGQVIRGEGGQYFGFLLVGMLTFSFIPLAITSLPNTITTTINNGTMEAVLGTPTSMPAMLVGMMGYPFIWATMRATAMLLAGSLLGASIAWIQAPSAFFLLLLIILAYVPIGLISASMYLAFRTTGPIATAVIAVSTLLGGVYYPSHVVPSWLLPVSKFVPLTYGLRALRRVLLEGASLLSVWQDVVTLLLMTVFLFAIGGSLLAAAMRYARKTGSLSYY
jgi:ABC-2 type transport system permease protein